jgi:hypothetical protein
MTIDPGVANFYTFENTNGVAAANRLLFSWLSDDKLRRQLYADMTALEAPLFFSSNASKRDTVHTDVRDFDWIDGPRDYYQKAVLLAHPKHVEHALTCSNILTAGDGTHESIQVSQNLDYSNSPYQGLGGFFMLALDAPTAHDYQRKFALKMLRMIKSDHYDALATLSFKGGALVPLKQHEFDLTAMAEGIAVRYVLGVFGFPQKDIALVQECTRKIGRGLQYQIMGRHFVFEPSTMLESRAALAKLSQRATEIMQYYVHGGVFNRTEQDEKDEIDEDIARIGAYEFQIDATGRKRKSLAAAPASPAAFMPILQRMANDQAVSGPASEFGLVEKGLIAASLVGGSVTNIQNSICICLAEIFKLDAKNLVIVRNDAIDERARNPDAQWLPDASKIVDLIKEAMRISPPVVFVPRRANRDVQLNPKHRSLNTVKVADPIQHSNIVEKDTLVLVALAGASCPNIASGTAGTTALSTFRFDPSPARMQQNFADSERNYLCPFSKTMGGPPLLPSAWPLPPKRWTYTHSCPGMMMSMHVIAYSIRQLLVLPSLAQSIDADTGKPYGLEKRWGFQSTNYPLSYQRERLLVQTPLQTVLPIKTPVDLHSQELRKVIGHGAPFIEKVLHDSKMVHFASFMFLENDSKLVLFTMYDGDFDAYIGHFAKEFGHLFDRFFSHIAISPPMPIKEHPFEFVQYLKQFLRPPVEGYYFSAYPETTTHRISNHFTPQFDFNVIRGS